MAEYLPQTGKVKESFLSFYCGDGGLMLFGAEMCTVKKLFIAGKNVIEPAYSITTFRSKLQPLPMNAPAAMLTNESRARYIRENASNTAATNKSICRCLRLLLIMNSVVSAKATAV